MIYVNDLYRVYYIAQNFTTGLTDVQISITKPDLSTVGYFVMTEIPAKPGVYYYDYILLSVGKYILDCNSVSVPARRAETIEVVPAPLLTSIPIAYFDNI